MLISYSVMAALLLLLVAWISMTEASLFSVSRLALERLKHELETGKAGRGAGLHKHRRRVAQVEELLSHPNRLLGSVLVANTLFSVALSAVGTLLGVLAAHQSGRSEAFTLVITGVVLLAALLVLGEVVPKMIAVRRPMRTALAFAPATRDLVRVLAPLADALERAATAIVGRAKPELFPTEAELVTMIELGRERGVIVGEEGTILSSLVGLSKRRVSEIMTPRITMVSAEKNRPANEVVSEARQRRCSRVPVYEGTIDHIIGIFYLKDFFGLESDTVPVGTVARDAYHVPEVKSVSALLEEFRRQGVHIAVVIDEFGQTAGVVTLEDVLEAIFGEIRDEYDLAEELPYFQIDARTWLVDGEIDLPTLNRQFPGVFHGERLERLAGFIHHQLGRLPAEGETLRVGGLTLEIRQVTGNAIEKVLIRCS
jgi:CBS domain containing-hemolysin-like protein